jgi:hypothetical protein
MSKVARRLIRTLLLDTASPAVRRLGASDTSERPRRAWEHTQRTREDVLLRIASGCSLRKGKGQKLSLLALPT